MDIEARDKWEKDFRLSYQGKLAIEGLAKLRSYEREQPFEIFEKMVLINCYKAATYSRTNDPNERHRRKDAQLLDQFSAFSKNLDEIKCFIEKYKDIIPKDELAKELVKYEKSLDEYVSNIASQLVAHRRRIGPFLYSNCLDEHSARPDIAATGLLFSLVKLFKEWTALHEVQTLTGLVSLNGIPGAAIEQMMPQAENGEPCYKIACQFLKATLDRDMEPEQVRSRLQKLIRRNEGIAIIDWPD